MLHEFLVSRINSLVSKGEQLTWAVFGLKNVKRKIGKETRFYRPNWLKIGPPGGPIREEALDLVLGM